MEKIFAVLQVIAPIFAAVALGVLAKRRSMMSSAQVQGIQRFVTKFCLPCVLFNSCLSASVELQSLTSMAFVDLMVLTGALLSFSLRRKKYPYHNLPMLFSAQESGMLGIPLYLALFGAEHMFRMGVLDVAQSFVAIPVIALLSADAGQNPTPADILRSVMRSPLLIAAVLGLLLNFSGAMVWLGGFAPVLTETTGFLSQPVSAAMLFSVGYNFSLAGDSIRTIVRLAVLHFCLFAAFGAAMIACLLVTASPDLHTIWAAVLYSTLPASFLSPSFGRSEEEAMVASGVCSVLTVVSLLIFCVAAVCTA